MHPRTEHSARLVKLLVSVRGLSGTLYPAGTEVFTAGHGPEVDGFVEGDWVPLRWWEFAESQATRPGAG